MLGSGKRDMICLAQSARFEAHDIMSADYDPSHGYDAEADAYARLRSDTGHAVIEMWAKGLPSCGHVLDLGAGTGFPVTQALCDAGLTVTALDASPAMVSMFKTAFPDVSVWCEPVENSDRLDQSYDGIAAIGLIFLLPETSQRDLIRKMVGALRPGGALIMSAPLEEGEWRDRLTGRMSLSLGRAQYTQCLRMAGLHALSFAEDRGGNHYYIGWMPS